MAIMHPDVAPDQIIHGSERDVYIALRDQLPQSYRVVHSLPWLRPDRDSTDAPLREGEADFVIFHPDYGLLVLEVKGGEEMFIEYKRLVKVSAGVSVAIANKTPKATHAPGGPAYSVPRRG